MPNKRYDISIYEVWPDMKDYIKDNLKGFEVKTYEELLTKKNLDKDTEILTVFAGSPVTKEIINSLPKLKMIATMSTGYNHIDTKAAKKKKIPVCNVPVYGQNTVAEHAFALILGLSRKIFPSVKRVKEGSFEYRGLRGVDLSGKTLGVVGTGNIGKHLIKMAKGFDMNVVCFDAFPNKTLEKKLGFKYMTLDKLLSLSDFISLHVPLFPSTFHLINKKNIKKIKKGAYLVNTARGELIESEALLSALENGTLAGAGLDVLEEENHIKDEGIILHEKGAGENIKTKKTKGLNAKQIKTMLINEILIDHPNTIITPHNAFNSTEALQRIINTTVDNIKSFAKGKIENDVTKPKKN